MHMATDISYIQDADKDLRSFVDMNMYTRSAELQRGGRLHGSRIMTRMKKERPGLYYGAILFGHGVDESGGLS